jgi:hypothetical protein
VSRWNYKRGLSVPSEQAAPTSAPKGWDQDYVRRRSGRVKRFTEDEKRALEKQLTKRP